MNFNAQPPLCMALGKALIHLFHLAHKRGKRLAEAARRLSIAFLSRVLAALVDTHCYLFVHSRFCDLRIKHVSLKC